MPPQGFRSGSSVGIHGWWYSVDEQDPQFLAFEDGMYTARNILVLVICLTTAGVVVGAGDVFDGVSCVLCSVLVFLWNRARNSASHLCHLYLQVLISVICLDMVNRVEGYPDGELLRVLLLDGVFVFLGVGAVVLGVLGRRRTCALALVILLLPVVQAPALGMKQLAATRLTVPESTNMELQYVTRITNAQVYGVAASRPCAASDGCLRGLVYHRSGHTLELDSWGALGRFGGSMDDQWPNVHPLLRPLLISPQGE